MAEASALGGGVRDGLQPAPERVESGRSGPYRVQKVASPTAQAPAPRPDGRFTRGNQAAKSRQLRLVRLDSVSKIKRTLWEIIAGMRKGTIRADAGNAIVNGCRLLLQLHQVEEQDARVAETQREVERLRAVVIERLGGEPGSML